MNANEKKYRTTNKKQWISTIQIQQQRKNQYFFFFNFIFHTIIIQLYIIFNHSQYNNFVIIYVSCLIIYFSSLLSFVQDSNQFFCSIKSIKSFINDFCFYPRSICKIEYFSLSQELLWPLVIFGGNHISTCIKTFVCWYIWWGPKWN